ncbi:hypothetical protein SEVIR_9G445300v4 [Setaria viridis]|uniref:V-SNARE coiled-coil homology domain-containing protein n=1 Tax=Setaria viridis TaxID=4556 RepID=A0A4U6T8T6_SETVI|nr:uncharacterized protein LOC117838980 [Setaria viridis]TKV96692.1 hypothetical protein SEVIR_9G445300v2 [Setaria viridis]
MGNKGPTPTQELTIDDIKVDDEAPSKPAPQSTSVVNSKTKTDVEREQLFEGSSDFQTPRKKSTQEILTKYKFKGDAAAAAAHAKQKLMERQEKLARITEQSAELESEAENFATLAQQIRKNMENKWWKR